VRQLILEYVEGDREIPPRISDRSPGHRTSLALKGRIMNALEDKIEAEGHLSKGAVIAYLLRQFLVRTPANDSEMVDVTVQLPSGVYNDLANYCKARGLSMNQLLAGTVQDLLDRIAMQSTRKGQ
jgi:hypothetical protein